MSYMHIPRLPHRAARGASEVIAALCFAAGAFATTAAAAPTTMVQKPGLAGCVSLDGIDSCTSGRGIRGVRSVTISPDGANAYVASEYGDSLAVLDRAVDGTLTQKAGVAGCISDDGNGPCADATAFRGPQDVAISPDGRSVYVTTTFSGAVAVLDRAADGTLTQKSAAAGCVSEAGVGPCNSGHDLANPGEVVVSPDGATVYVASVNGKLLVFDRAPDGALTQRPGVAGCVADVPSATCADGRALAVATGVAMSSDGHSLYVSGRDSNAIAVFDRAVDGTLAQKAGAAGCISADTSGGMCGLGKALRGPTSVALSADDADVYVTAGGSAAVSAFGRATDGTLTQKPGIAGCVSSMESGGACANAIFLTAPMSIAVSPDGANAYVTTRPALNFLVPDGALVVFDRAPDGSLVQKAGQAGCIYQGAGEAGAGPPRCVLGRGLRAAAAVAVSPDSANAYVAGRDSYALAIFGKGPFVAPPPPPAGRAPPPALSGLALAPASFRASRAGPSIGKRGGGRVSYRLSKIAVVRFTVQRVAAGRRVGGRCAQATMANRRAKRCDRHRALPGSFAIAGNVGRNTLRFSGRLAKHALVAGRYRLRAEARDAAANLSGPRFARFTIRRR